MKEQFSKLNGCRILSEVKQIVSMCKILLFILAWVFVVSLCYNKTPFICSAILEGKPLLDYYLDDVTPVGRGGWAK